LVERLDLTGPRVDSTSPQRRKAYHSLPFSLQAAGSLNQLTELLFAFYRAPHLHRIRAMNISPMAHTGKLSFSLGIEALVVDRVDRSDSLASGVSEELAFDHLDAYRLIPRRNIFSPKGGIGALEQTVLTAVVWVDGVAEAWFTDQRDGQIYKVRESEVLQLGAFAGRVVRIGDKSVVVVAGGGSQLLAIDHPLSDALVMPQGQASGPRAPAK
jgi:hypothetical protein